MIEPRVLIFFFFNDTATTEIYTLSLHDALPIFHDVAPVAGRVADREQDRLALTLREAERLLAPGEPVHGIVLVLEQVRARSEEHTSELQSRQYLVCRLLLEKKKNTTYITTRPPF